jgi:mono/diheme cytochrome c family protein
MKYKLILTFLLLAGIICAIAISCTQSPGQVPGTVTPTVTATTPTPFQSTTPPQAVSPPPTISAIDPAQIYTVNCAGCHGNDRKGGVGPNITATALANLTASDLANFIGRHQTGRNLSTNDLLLLSNWLKSTP